MKKCPNCGSEYDNSHFYCLNCGMSLTGSGGPPKRNPHKPEAPPASAPVPHENTEPPRSASFGSSERTAAPPPPPVTNYTEGSMSGSNSDVPPPQPQSDFVSVGGNAAPPRQKNGMFKAIAVGSVLLVGASAVFISLGIKKSRQKEYSFSSQAVQNTTIYTEPAETQYTTAPVSAYSDNGYDEQAQIYTETATEPLYAVTNEPQTDANVHKQFIISNEALTWEDAQRRCEERGGHLAYIKSWSEFNDITSALESAGLKFAWVGATSFITENGARAIWKDGSQMVFVYSESLWYPGEPSGRDERSADKNIEPYVMLCYINDKWCFNDCSDAALSVYKKSSIGYICEIDNGGNSSAEPLQPVTQQPVETQATVQNSSRQGRVVTKQDDLNVRNGPSTSAKKIGTVAKGSTVDIISYENGWYLINFSGGTGYVSGDFIAVDGASPSVEPPVVNDVNKTGILSFQGGEVSGYDTSYVVNGGSVSKVRTSLGNGWHIRAVKQCVSGGITWYELYDSEDNDYYGWVDSSFIVFD